MHFFSNQPLPLSMWITSIIFPKQHKTFLDPPCKNHFSVPHPHPHPDEAERSQVGHANRRQFSVGRVRYYTVAPQFQSGGIVRRAKAWTEKLEVKKVQKQQVFSAILNDPKRKSPR